MGLTGNADKGEFASVVRKAAQLIARSGREVWADAVAGPHAGRKACIRPGIADLAREVDLLLVLGGDGTILRVADEVAGASAPLLGINIGGLGFLTSVSSSQLAVELRQVWRGEFTLEPRAMIEADGVCCGSAIHALALNDLVISRGEPARLIEIEVSVDDIILARYRADGLVVSTPTGSTAYSLAAGGALICPNANVIELTPICPHTLSNRAVIASLESVIRVRVTSSRPAILCADGQAMHNLAGGDEVTIRRSDKTVTLMRLAGVSFFEILRRKLHWRGGSL